MLAGIVAGSAFVAPTVHAARTPQTRPAVHKIVAAEEDPTANPFIQAINGFQEAIQNSPIVRTPPRRRSILAAAAAAAAHSTAAAAPARARQQSTSTSAAECSTCSLSSRAPPAVAAQANFKSKLAEMQAGDYDVDATAAKLNSLIEETPVVMFSFST
jgi:hypothetical protein